MSNSDFLRLAANARRKQLGQEELGPLEFYGYVMPKVPQHTLGNGELPGGIYSYTLPSTGSPPGSHSFLHLQLTC